MDACTRIECLQAQKSLFGTCRLQFGIVINAHLYQFGGSIFSYIWLIIKIGFHHRLFKSFVNRYRKHPVLFAGRLTHLSVRTQ